MENSKKILFVLTNWIRDVFNTSEPGPHLYNSVHDFVKMNLMDTHPNNISL